jgi:hypothetical protein
MSKYIHEYVKAKEDDLDYYLEWFSGEGWDLVSVANGISNDDLWFFLFFKKPIQE